MRTAATAVLTYLLGLFVGYVVTEPSLMYFAVVIGAVVCALCGRAIGEAVE